MEAGGEDLGRVLRAHGDETGRSMPSCAGHGEEPPDFLGLLLQKGSDYRAHGH